MNKKENNDELLISEDKQIKKVALKSKNKINIFLIIILLMLFLFTLYIALSYINSYFHITVNPNEEIITVQTENATTTIVNNGVIDETITEDYFSDEDEIIIENIDTLELVPQTNNETIILKYNVSYNITNNDFEANTISSNSSPVTVRFSYSLDNENWTYVSNALSTYNSNILPLVGNTYDIAGLNTTISVATNYELSTSSSSSIKVYWRSETIFKDKNSKVGNNFAASFTISYSSSN